MTGNFAGVIINRLALNIDKIFDYQIPDDLIDKVTIGSHVQITGEVVNIQADESILDERGKYSLEKLKPIIYDEENWRYLAVGEKAADAFKCGLVFKKA